MGTHGEFDNLALSVCRAIRNTNSNIEIEVVITSLKNLQKQIDQIYTPYSDVKTIMYDIENKHYETQKQ